MFRYQNNAFRILGLKPDVSMKEIIHRVNEIKVKTSLGMDVVYEYDFPWMGTLDRSEQSVINALQRLENPITRLGEEIFWFWFDTNHDKEAINYLVQNNRQPAHDTWKALVTSEILNRKSISAFMNQAVLAHSSVIGKEIKVRYREETEDHKILIVAGSDGLCCPKCHRKYDSTWKVCLECRVKLENGLKERTVKKKKRDADLSETHWKNWRFVINRFTSITSKKIFWTIVKEKAEKINDPRLSAAKVDEIGDNFLQNVASANFTFISQALISKDYERIKQHSGLLNGSLLSSEVLRKGFNRVLAPEIDLLNRHSQTASKELLKIEKDKTGSNKVILDLYSKLVDQTADIVYEGDLVDINAVSDFALAKDNLARVMRDSAIVLNNILVADFSLSQRSRELGYSHAYEMIKKALDCAGSTYSKQKFEKDEELIKKNMEANRSYGNYSQPTSHASSGFNWKPLLIWGGIILFFIIIGNLPDDSSSYKASPPKSSYISQERTALSLDELKLKIDTLRQELEEKSVKLATLDADLDIKGKRLLVLKNEIQRIDRKYGNRNYVPNSVISEYNRKIDEYNRSAPIYNNVLNRRKELYNETFKKGKIHDSLVESYNERVR